MHRASDRGLAKSGQVCPDRALISGKCAFSIFGLRSIQPEMLFRVFCFRYSLASHCPQAAIVSPVQQDPPDTGGRKGGGLAARSVATPVSEEGSRRSDTPSSLSPARGQGSPYRVPQTKSVRQAGKSANAGWGLHPPVAVVHDPEDRGDHVCRACRSLTEAGDPSQRGRSTLTMKELVKTENSE